MPVYELGGRGKDPDPFYTMRFVRGRTLAEAVRGYHHRRQAEQAGPLELRELLGALVAACNAVAYAHSRGVVHRDLKPQNVVLGDYGEVIVLDWGMAKVVDAPDATEPAAARLAAPAPAEPSDTQPGQVLGTPAYMAPEQAAGRPDLVDFRTDVYGLGAILYEILTGAPPFSGPDTREVLRRVCDEEPVRPRRGTIPAALEAVCRKAMAKAPAERYPSARRLAQDLEHWLADEPVSAYVEPWAGRTGRWLRRHRTLVRAGSAALVLTAVTFAVATVLLVAANERVRRARDDAVRSEREATRQRDLARQAVDTFYTQVSDSPELRARGAERLRTRLLETALRFYEEMLRETPGGTAVRQDQARAQRRVGDLYFALGRHPEAGAAYEAAQRLFGILAEDQPDTAGNREAQAACLLSLGNLHKETGARDRAEQSYRAGEDLLRRLSEADPDNVMYRSNLAAARGRLGMLYLDGGRYGPAETAFREGLAAFERALEQGPARTDALGNVARAHEALGFVYLRTGRDAQAEESLTRAGGLYEKLVALDPAEQHALAENRLSLSKFYLDKGKPDRAERPVRRALELFEALAAAHPDVPGYQADVARAANNLATMYYLRQEMEPAAQEFARALDIHRKLARSHPLVPAYRRDLARHANNLAVLYLNKGKFEDAERLAREALTAREQLVAAEPTVAVYRDELASGYVNLANLYKSRQRAEAAERAFRDAVAQYEKLTSTNQPAPAYRAGLAQTLHDLGILLSESGRRAEAQQLYSRAVSIQQCLVHDHADVTAYAVALGGTCCDLGNLLGDGDDPAAALPWYDQAVAALDRVRTREPGNAMARTFLRNSWWGRADTLGKLDRHRDALAAWDRVLELTPDTAGDRTSCRAARAVTLAHLGDHVL